MDVTTGNLFTGLPAAGPAEMFEPLGSGSGMTVERLVSHGQATPPGEWYDQPAAEWVVVLAGAARLRVEGQPDLLLMNPGDWVFLPAGLKHRVEWTAPDRHTIWLAVHDRPALAASHHPSSTGGGR